MHVFDLEISGSPLTELQLKAHVAVKLCQDSNLYILHSPQQNLCDYMGYPKTKEAMWASHRTGNLSSGPFFVPGQIVQGNWGCCGNIKLTTSSLADNTKPLRITGPKVFKSVRILESSLLKTQDSFENMNPFNTVLDILFNCLFLRVFKSIIRVHIRLKTQTRLRRCAFSQGSCSLKSWGRQPSWLEAPKKHAPMRHFGYCTSYSLFEKGLVCFDF